MPFCWLDFRHADVAGNLLNITVLVVGRQVSVGLDCLDHQLASMRRCFVCAGERLEAVHGRLRQHHEHDQRQGGCCLMLDSSPAALANKFKYFLIVFQPVRLASLLTLLRLGLGQHGD